MHSSAIRVMHFFIILINGILFNKNKTCLIKFPAKKFLSDYTIPKTVTLIDDYAFDYCNNLINIVISDSVTDIRGDAFSMCTGLTNVTLGSGIKSIGNGVFKYCERLTDVHYTGTIQEWKKISIGSNNTYLKNATKHYNYIIKDKDKLYFNEVDNKAELESKNAISNAVLIFSLYKDNMLVDIKTLNVSIKEGENEFENLISDYQNAGIMKIMIWDNLKETNTPFTACETKLN